MLINIDLNNFVLSSLSFVTTIIILSIVIESITELLVTSDFPIISHTRNTTSKLFIKLQELELHCDLNLKMVFSTIFSTKFVSRLSSYLYCVIGNVLIVIFRNVIYCLYKYTTCGYCSSVFVSILVSLLIMNVSFDYYVFDNILIRIFLLCRLSNAFHDFYKLRRFGRVDTRDYVVILKREKKEANDGV